MRTGHRGSLHDSIRVAGSGTEYLKALHVVSAGSAYIHPAAVVGIVCRLVVRRDGSHRETGLIRCRIAGRKLVIAGCENDQAAGHRAHLGLAVRIHSRILGKIIYGCLHEGRRIAQAGFFIESPAVLRDYRTFVGSLLDGPCKSGIGGSVLTLEYLLRHDAHAGYTGSLVTSCHTADTDTVVVDGSNRTRNVGTVLIGSNRLVFINVVVTVGAVGGINPHILGQILMRGIHTSVHDGHNHLRTVGRISVADISGLPHGQDIDIRTGYGIVSRSVIIIVPLIVQSGIIEQFGCLVMLGPLRRRGHLERL